MQNLKTYVTDHKDHKVISVEGEINLFNIERLRNAIESIMEDPPSSLLIDLKNVFSIDSTGIATLYATQKKVEALKGNFYLANMDENLMNIIAITGIKFNTIELKGIENI